MGKKRLAKELFDIHQKYSDGELTIYEFIDQKHMYNKLLLTYSKLIENTDISKIEITSDSVVFEFQPLGIKLATDGAARSAPFEVLNFGNYEEADERILYYLCKGRQILFDLGANLGWYAVNLGKRFPTLTIHSFEPIHETYNTLKKNIKLNSLENVVTHELGVSDTASSNKMYFFKGGSAVASMKNLLNTEKAIPSSCKFKSIDQICSEQKLTSLDIMKIDIEGAELLALKGADLALKNFKPILLVEIVREWCQAFNYVHSEIFELLYSYGYQSYVSKNNGLSEVTPAHEHVDGKYNYFFLHKELHSSEIENLVIKP